MRTNVQKWGNSQGVRLPKQLLEEIRIGIGEAVEISAKDGVLVISPVRRVRRKHDLKELVARIPKQYRAREIDWGRPVGKEVW